MIYMLSTLASYNLIASAIMSLANFFCLVKQNSLEFLAD